MIEYHSAFRDKITGFLDFHASCGFKRKPYLSDFMKFDRWCLENHPGQSALSRELVHEWIDDSAVSRSDASRRAVVMRQVEYMSMKAVSAILEQPDANTPRGRRDRCFIILMYDTGARIQELVSIRLYDLHISRLSRVRLHGKGGKIRDVPLMEKTVLHLKKYLEEFHSGKPFSSEDPLFYSSAHGAICPISGRRIRYLLQEYGKKARAVCPEVPESVYSHLFRHSRAMHLYQAGMDLTHISQWLGHSQLETSQIYAYADTEHKRKAIEASTPPDNPLYSKLNSARCTVTDEELLKKLTGLR